MLAHAPMRAEHLPAALALSRTLDWPYRLEDWAFAYRLGRGLVIEVAERLAGTALWWPMGRDHATAGMIIVSADAQRKGIGRLLMDALLADAAGRTLLLNSTQEGFALYSRLGFVQYGQVHQHQSILPPLDAPRSLDHMRDYQPGDRDALGRLDFAASGMDRKALLDALLPVSDVKLVTRAGQLCGYAGRRTWGRGLVIGPVVAAEAADARALITALAEPCAGRFVRIDVTAANGLSPWLCTIGLPQVGSVAAMARGARPQATGATLFALSNQSFG